MENSITIKADEFKYPSKEEIREALKDYPDIELFHFEHKHPNLSSRKSFP